LGEIPVSRKPQAAEIPEMSEENIRWGDKRRHGRGRPVCRVQAAEAGDTYFRN